MSIYIFCSKLTIERDAARNRTEHAGSELLVASKDLEARRQELYAFRRATFESYVAQNPPPPNYDVARVSVSGEDNSSTAVGGSSDAENEVEEFFQTLATNTQSTNSKVPTSETTIRIPSSVWGGSEFKVVYVIELRFLMREFRESICFRYI